MHKNKRAARLRVAAGMAVPFPGWFGHGPPPFAPAGSRPRGFLFLLPCGLHTNQAQAMDDLKILDHPEQHRYIAHAGAQEAAHCEYNMVGDAIMFTHTEVEQAFEGKGVGSRLARHVLDDARARGLHVIPVCQFIAGYLRKHREYVDLVRADIARAFKI